MGGAVAMVGGALVAFGLIGAPVMTVALLLGGIGIVMAVRSRRGRAHTAPRAGSGSRVRVE